MDKKRILYITIFIIWIASIIYIGFYAGPLETYTINGSCGYHVFYNKTEAENYYKTFCWSPELDPKIALRQNFSHLKK
jgi:hypothetical protein